MDVKGSESGGGLMDVQLRCFPGRKKENHENLQ
jgi:hypothetical protein